MTKYSLEELKQKIDELAQKIDAPREILPGYGEAMYDGYPYVDIDRSGTLYYIVKERGKEIKWLKTYKLDELLFAVFKDVTRLMATKFELKNRIEDKDSRRMWFKKQEELLATLNQSWGDKEKEDHDKILLCYPFDDLAHMRALFCRELRLQGLTEAEINKLAYEKYPKN